MSVVGPEAMGTAAKVWHRCDPTKLARRRSLDVVTTVSAVLAAVAAGDLTPADAGEISKLIEAYVRAFETAELAERLEQLERMTSQ